MAKKMTDILAWVRSHRKSRSKKEGLRMTQVRILYALHANPDGMTREGIAKHAGVGEQVLIVSIGPLDPSCREAADKRMGYPGLLSLGMIQPDIKVLDEKVGEQLVYVLTDKGQKEFKKQKEKYGDKLPEPRVGNPKEKPKTPAKAPPAKAKAKPKPKPKPASAPVEDEPDEKEPEPSVNF